MLTVRRALDVVTTWVIPIAAGGLLAGVMIWGFATLFPDRGYDVVPCQNGTYVEDLADCER